VRNLVDIASKGGNYLLNVGPKPDGTFPEPIVERLAGIGKWMAVNGESIYGTGPSPFTSLDKSMRVTTKPGTVYLHVFEWPKEGNVRLPDLHREVKEAYLLAGHAAVKAAKADGEIRIDAPASAPDPIDSVIVMEVEGEGKAASQ
jgi:alpha-L-fucosidase